MARQRVALIAAIFLPIILIIGLVFVAYIPRAMAPKPEFNFLYVSNYYYYDKNRGQYSVIQNKLAEKPMTYAGRIQPPNSPAEFYIYDTKKNEVKAVSLEEAKKLKLSGKKSSPDDFTITTKVYDPGFLGLFSSYNSGRDTPYLTGHGVTYKLDIPNKKPSWRYENFYFLGWVVDNE